MIKKVVIYIISGYQKVFSPDTGIFKYLYKTGQVCTFYPTCSEYTLSAVKKYGVLKGLFLGFKRVIRCHPWQKEHIDLLK